MTLVSCPSCGCGELKHLWNCATLSKLDLENTSMSVISFKGPFRWLSNFAPCTVYLESIAYPSVEHAYQAAKTVFPALRVPFESGTSADAKRMGSKLAVRPDWEQIKLAVMEALLNQKFLEGTDYRKQLDATKGMELIEGNWWHDNVYGSCMCEKCGDTGRNELGKMLMRIRDGG